MFFSVWKRLRMEISPDLTLSSLVTSVGHDLIFFLKNTQRWIQIREIPPFLRLVVGGWTKPFEKHVRQNGFIFFPNIGVNMKNIGNKPPHSLFGLEKVYKLMFGGFYVAPCFFWGGGEGVGGGVEVDGCVRFFDVFLLMLVIPPKKKRGGRCWKVCWSHLFESCGLLGIVRCEKWRKFKKLWWNVMKKSTCKLRTQLFPP